MSQQRKKIAFCEHLTKVFRTGLGVGALILPFLAGCQGYSVTGGPGPLVSEPLRVTRNSELPGRALKSIVVLPLQNGVGVELSDEDLAQGTKLLLEELQSNSSLSVINLSEEKSTNAAIEKVLDKKTPAAMQAKLLGQSIGAKAVLYGALTKYAPFTGGSSPESPIRFSGSIDDGDFNNPQDSLRGGVASPTRTLPGGVGFRLFLIDPLSGQTLWSSTFDLQERSVAENLFQLKRQLELAGSRAELERILRLGLRSAVKDLELAKSQKN